MIKTLHRKRFIHYIETTWLPTLRALPTSLRIACVYAMTPPGQLLRPILCYNSCEDHHLALSLADPCALSLEMIHTYSLIHDDLPCMDDDDIRRNKPSLHRQFGESVALLVGDALHSEAFKQLAESHVLTPTQQAKLIAELSKHSGLFGMIEGQYKDLYQDITTRDELLPIFSQKTGRLFEYAMCLGFYLKGETPPESFRSLTHHFGQWFQIHNDFKTPLTATHKEWPYHFSNRQNAQEAFTKETKQLLTRIEQYKPQFPSMMTHLHTYITTHIHQTIRA